MTDVPTITPKDTEEVSSETTDTSETPSTEGLSEHDAAMVAKAREQSSADDAARKGVTPSTEEAEEPAQEADTKVDADTPKDGDDTGEGGSDEAAKEADAGDEASPTLDWTTIDRDALGREIIEHGSLTEETVKQFTDTGIPKEFVDAFVEGQKAVAQIQINGLFDIVGGRDEFTQMVEWAGNSGMSEERIKTFNDALGAPASENTKMLVEQLHGAYKAANGSAPSLIQGDTVQQPSDTFKTRGDVTKAMKDPRYGASTTEGREYTASVMDKMRRSQVKWS